MVQRWCRGGAKVLQRCRDGAEVSDAEVMQWFCIGSAAEVVQRCRCRGAKVLMQRC